MNDTITIVVSKLNRDEMIDLIFKLEEDLGEACGYLSDVVKGRIFFGEINEFLDEPCPTIVNQDTHDPFPALTEVQARIKAAGGV